MKLNAQSTQIFVHPEIRHLAGYREASLSIVPHSLCDEQIASRGLRNSPGRGLVVGKVPITDAVLLQSPSRE